MRSWRRILTDSMQTGAVASAATTVAVAACGELEEGRAVPPLNAVSHIVWGEEAAERDELSFKYTATGLALNAAAVTSWAVVHELLAEATDARRDLGRSLATGAAVAAIAYVTDYHLVPERFTPGFEKRLSGRSLLGIYSALALSLGLGSWLRRPRSPLIRRR